MARLLVALALVCGCNKKHADPEAELVRANLLRDKPSLERSLRAELGGGVIYLGNEIDSERARPGGTVTITHYLEIIREPDSRDPLVARVGDSPADQPPSPMQRAYPASRWKAKDIIRDRQIVDVPEDASGSLALRVARGDVEAVVGQVAVEGGRDYPVHRTSRPIELDGVPDPAWRAAAWSPRFVVAKGGREIPGDARARLLWDDAHLYVLVEVVDPQIFSPFEGRDDTLWKADVVEIFIDADRNRRGYVELQVNPRGAIFDAFFPVGRGQKHHFEWNSRLRAGVKVDGDPADKGSRDRGWVVEMAIPHGDVVGMAKNLAGRGGEPPARLGNNEMLVKIPPEVGDRWNLNVVRVDQPGGKGISAATWNPITIRDFHALSRMLTVTFAE